MKFIKKNWFIIVIIYLCLIRFIISYGLPSFYMTSLKFDDALMVHQLKSLIAGEYLGYYSDVTLIKGIIFPLLMFGIKSIHVSYSICLTILYIAGSIFLVNSLRKLIDNKVILIIILFVILFNPVSYSSELFQRMYVNTICITELLFFLGLLINVIVKKGNNVLNYIFLGLITTIMYLTRNDSIWVFVILFIVFVLKIIKDFKIKTILINLIPVVILILGLNVVRFVNYKYYGLYTYNELEDSNFKKAYTKLLLIKDDVKYEQVAVPKSTFVKLAELTDEKYISKDTIDKYYYKVKDSSGEIDNGNIIWSFREMIYQEHRFKNATEANELFGKLSDELDKLFNDGKLEKEFSLPLVFINMPTKSELLKLPKNTLKAMWYTSSYQNIKTYTVDTLKDINPLIPAKFKPSTQLYGVYYTDYRNSENMGKNNILVLEIVRIIYKYFTIVFSFLAFGVFILNIKKKDYLNYFTILVALSYIVILMVVVYTHTTGFPAIRYRYLSNIYILQSLFILLNIERFRRNIKNKNK